jgi:Ca2+-binding RTX toxin-like protein
MRGDSGVDHLFGEGDGDKLFTLGDDEAHGGPADDHLQIGAGAPLVYGDGGADRIDTDINASTPGAAHIYGGTGRDQIFLFHDNAGKVAHGGADDDTLVAYSDGGATLDGGPGHDVISEEYPGTIVGGDGDDSISADNALSPSRNTVSCGAGYDTVRVDRSDLFGSDCESVVVIIVDGPGGNTVVGTAYDDQIDAGDGADDVSGLEGDDSIELGEGKDTAHAGLGDDIVFAHYGWSAGVTGDVDTVACGPGNDRALVDDVDHVSPDCETVQVFPAPK